MSEKLHLIRPDGKTVIDAKIASRYLFPFDNGAEHPQRVALDIYSYNRSREISMVMKEPTSFDRLTSFRSNKPADWFISIWTQLKEAGISVVPTLRKVSDTQVIMTDLTRDGSIVYGKHQAKTPYLLPKDVLSQEVHQSFLRINYEDLCEELRKVFDKATKQNIALASDGSLDIVAKPNGTWYPVALDIGYTSFNCKVSKMINEDNLQVVSYHILEIKNYLRKLYT